MQTKRIAAPCAALALGVAGFFLRRWELATGFDQQGLNVPCTAVWVLAALSGAVVLAALIFGLTQKPATRYYQVFPQSTGLALLRLLGALLVMASCVIALGESTGLFHTIVLLLGAAAGVCLLAGDALYLKGQAPQPWAELVPVFFLILLIIYDFRHWSIDPVVLDYCFRLFALLSCMGFAYAWAGYGFNQGRRKSLCLFGMLCVFFCVTSLADGQLSQMLLMGGWALRALVALGCAAGASEDPAETDTDPS